MDLGADHAADKGQTLLDQGKVFNINASETRLSGKSQEQFNYEEQKEEKRDASPHKGDDHHLNDPLPITSPLVQERLVPANERFTMTQQQKPSGHHTKGSVVGAGTQPNEHDDQMTYFVFRGLAMTRANMIKCTTAMLFVSIFFERYCFIVTVYKTKYYGYVLILIVVALNCIFNLILSRLRKKKQKKRLHELFNIERTPSVGCCIIGIVGILDMLYAFFLFWPANTIPIWLLITLLQFFIPLNMLMRSCCLKLQHNKIHAIAGFTILAAVVINLIDLAQGEYAEMYMQYALLFMLCSLFDVMSHALKEGIVRTQPLNQEKFNFQISVSQLAVGVIIAPMILQISKEYEDYTGTPLEDYQDGSMWSFMGEYFSLGFKCVFSGGGQEDTALEQCSFAWVYLLAYVLSLFALQLTLTTLMQNKRTKNARIIFAFMVPITLLAFIFGHVTNSGLIPTSDLEVYDVFALLIGSVGVFLYNWYEERPRKASIEEL